MSYSKPNSYYELTNDHPIDEARPIKVICIGAGVSGILTGIRLPQAIKNLELVIYEKNPEVGGTWYENVPGYQLTFENNPERSEFYSSGAEIQAYMLRTARKYAVHDLCRFRHMFKKAEWQEAEGKWKVTVEDLNSGKILIDYSDVIISATGLLNNWVFPKIPGLDTFKGKIVHTANWDRSIQLEGREVALVGAGSSGVQILPAIQPLVKRCDHYMKGKNWIPETGVGAEELVLRGEIGSGNFQHSPEELELYRRDPQAYETFRHRVEASLNQAQHAVFMGTQAQKDFLAHTHESMKKKLKDRPDILEFLVPSGEDFWPPGCKRLTPAPGYLEACIAPNVDFIGTGIKQINSDGIETVDGKIRKVDLIIFATGFDVTRKNEPIFVGQSGECLRDIWEPHPEAYLSMCPRKMPNMFIYFGPNGGSETGSTIHMLGWCCGYMIQCVKKLQREHIKSMVVSEEASRAFSDHVERHFAKTIFMQPCPSWFKRGQKHGRQVVSWPGSGVHARQSLMYPRFEDFEYEYMAATEENFFAWLGNGMTEAQVLGLKTTDYLDRPTARPEVNGTIPSKEGKHEQPFAANGVEVKVAC